MSVRAESAGGGSIGIAIVSGTARHNLFIDASGNLADTMAATLAGVLYDGDTNPYTGEQASIIANEFTRSIGDNDGNPVSPTLGSFVLTNPYSPSGSQTITNLALLGSAVISGTQNIGTETNYGVRGLVTRSGTIASSGSITINNIATSSLLTSTLAYNNAGLTVTETNIGHNIVVVATTEAGTYAGLTKNSYGLQIAVTSDAGADNSIYAIYVPTISGPDTSMAHGIHILADVDTYFRGDFGINTTTYSGQFSQVIDTASRTGYHLTGAASQSGSYISVVDSASNTVFTISPNSSAAAQTLTVQTLFDSADSVQARFQGPNRGTAANFDRFSWEFYNDDSNEAQALFNEIEFVAGGVSSSAKYGGMIFYNMLNNSLVQTLILGASALGGDGMVFNNGRANINFQVNGDNTLAVYEMDADLDANQFTVSSTRASAAGMTWDGMDVLASTLTVTSTTAVTNATGVNLVDIKRPTITDSSACTITNAATVRIAHSPLAAGSITITNAYALWIDDGTTRLDSLLDLSNIAAGSPNLSITATSDTPNDTWGVVTETFKVSAAPTGYLEIVVGGNARYIPFWT